MTDTRATDNKIAVSNSLADLRERLKIEHAAAKGAMKESLIHAMAAGDVLIEAKAQLKHGEWLPWLKTSGVPERTAQRYVRLARSRADIESKSDTVSDLGIRSALAMLAIRQDSGDPVARDLAGIADRIADSAFDFFAATTARKSEMKAAEGLRKEALAAVDEVIALVKNNPVLLESVSSDLERFGELITSGCRKYKAAVAAENGLTEAELDWFCSRLDDLESQGLDRDQRTWALLPDYVRIAREPSGPSSLAAITRVRDIACESLRCVERVASHRRHRS